MAKSASSPERAPGSAVEMMGAKGLFVVSVRGATTTIIVIVIVMVIVALTGIFLRFFVVIAAVVRRIFFVAATRFFCVLLSFCRGGRMASVGPCRRARTSRWVNQRWLE